MVFHPDLGYVEDGVDLSDAGLYKSAAQPFGRATILPPFSYQSKIFSDLEDEKLWTRSWIAIGTTHQIPNPGDLLPFTVGRHGVHVQREENGDLIGRFNKSATWWLPRNTVAMSNRQKNKMLLYFMRIQS